MAFRGALLWFAFAALVRANREATTLLHTKMLAEHLGEPSKLSLLLTNSNDVSSMKSLVQQLVKEPLSAEIKALLELVVAQLANVTVELESEVGEAAHAHGLQVQLFEDLAAAYQAELDGIGTGRHATTNEKRTEHAECRDEERRLRGLLAECRGREAASLTRFGAAKLAADGSGTAIGFCAGGDHWIAPSTQEQLNLFATEVQAAAEAREEYDRIHAECEGLQSDHDSQHDDCNSLQSEFEEASCAEGRDHTSANEHYENEYQLLLAAYGVNADAWSANSEHRASVCGALASIACYVDSISDSVNANGTDYDATDCDAIDHATGCASVWFEPPAAPEQSAMLLLPVMPVPCSASLDYGGVPSGELAACAPCDLGPVCYAEDECVDYPAGTRYDARFWRRECAKYCGHTDHLTMQMLDICGDGTDSFRPLSGHDLCEMLTSRDKAEWLAPSAEWVPVPPFLSFQHLGGSQMRWPASQGDDRTFLPFWGSTVYSGAATAGWCCNHAGDGTTHAGTCDWGRGFRFCRQAAPPAPPVSDWTLLAKSINNDLGFVDLTPTASDALGNEFMMTWSVDAPPSDADDHLTYERAVTFEVPGPITFAGRLGDSSDGTVSVGAPCLTAENFVLVDVTCIRGACNMPAQMYTGTGFRRICYNQAYGLVMNHVNPQCDWHMDTQAFKGLYLGDNSARSCHGFKDLTSPVTVPPAIAIWRK